MCVVVIVVVFLFSFQFKVILSHPSLNLCNQRFNKELVIVKSWQFYKHKAILLQATYNVKNENKAFIQSLQRDMVYTKPGQEEGLVYMRIAK